MNFGFNAKYKKKDAYPTGSVQIVLHGADLMFHITGYEWLVVDEPNAILKGKGTINGEGEYGLMLTIQDGKMSDGIDKIRIRIWDIETSETIYDNQMGDPIYSDATTGIEGGSIVLHT